MDTRGEHRFSSLMKKKGGGNYAVFYFAGKKTFLFIYFYDVIMEQFFYIRPVKHY
jgi:hypothetical protein